MADNQRFYSDFYDSVQQRASPALSPNALREGYRARLRFDTFLSKTVVLTDAQVLDGRFFLGEQPGDLIQWLRRKEIDESPPIEVRARADSVADAIVQLVKRPGSEHLKGFSFSSIENESERVLAERSLKRISACRISSWKDVPVILREIGVDVRTVEWIEQGWERWIEAERVGLVRFCRWPRPLDVDAALECEQRADIAARLASEEGRALVEWVWRHRADRSLIDTRCAELKAGATGEALVDIIAVEAWFHRGYNRAVARQNDAGFESTDPAIRAVSPLRELFDGIVERSRSGASPLLDLAIDLPDSFLEYLATMPGEQFRALLHDNGPHIERWWANGDRDSLRRAVDVFARTAVTRAGEDLPAWAKVPMRIATVAIGAAVGAQVGEGAVVGAVGGAILDHLAGSSIDHVLVEPLVDRASRMARRIVELADTRRSR